MLVHVMASCAAAGLIVWSHMVSGSAFRLLHLPDRMHVESRAYQDRAFATSTTNMVVATSTANVAVVSPVTSKLFDDTAKLAMDAQRRRDEVAQSEKKQAAGKHVNLEWQRHHKLDGSVFQSVKGQS